MTHNPVFSGSSGQKLSFTQLRLMFLFVMLVCFMHNIEKLSFLKSLISNHVKIPTCLNLKQSED